MQELRDAGTLELDPDSLAKRKEDAVKNKKSIVPSGNLTGFRVAPDLMKMDFTPLNN